MKNKLLVALLICVTCLLIASGEAEKLNASDEEITLNYLKHVVLDYAEKHRDKEVIVVSKSAHLLYFCKEGRIVEDKWNGFDIKFPVKVSLAGPYYRTPEGEMFVDRKNPYSRFTLFLSLSNPGDYGIHGAPTYLKSFLDKHEKQDPNFTYVTKKDDTRGCVAVENRVIKYLYSQVEVKTPVLIMP